MYLLTTSFSSTPRSLNNIQAGGTIWVASDIHLSSQTPATARAFLEFLDLAARQADALFLPGDVFDAWIGDDVALHHPPEWLLTLLDALSRVSRDTRLYLGHGNRDFLMGHDLAQRIGAQLLPDRACLQTVIGPVLLSHGDEYCTADTSYQRFRRVVRNPIVQRLFLSLSLRMRRGIANWARRRSQRGNQTKAMAIMDVDPVTIQAAFRESNSSIMVHGHTHRPAVHELIVDGRTCQRVVLPDWDVEHSQPPRGGWLAINESGLQIHDLSNHPWVSHSQS